MLLQLPAGEVARGPLAVLSHFGHRHFDFQIVWAAWLVVFAAGAAVFASRHPTVARRICATLDLPLRALSRRRSTAYLAAALMPLVAGLMILACMGFPEPAVHDELSYFLAAETFSLGRLTNPPFPEWIPFETFHVNQLPYYVSMYPPGKSLLMAAGMTFAGHAWFGIYLSVVLLGIASLWALEVWLPRRWALLGSFITGAAAAFTYWLTTYWGGALAACGGALVAGSSRRLSTSPGVRPALMFGLGAVILSNTRLWEGAFVTVAAAVAVLIDWHQARRRLDLGMLFRRVLIPLTLIAAAGLSWLGYYNWRLTGSPTLMPYVQNLRTYHVWPVVAFQERHPEVAHNHDVMRRLYWEEFHPNRAPDMQMFGGRLFLMPALVMPLLLPARRQRGLFLIAFAATAASMAAVWVRPHYLAPGMVAWIGVGLEALRTVQRYRWARLPVRGALYMWFAGTFARRAILLLLIAMHHPWAPPDPAAWTRARHSVESNIAAKGGKHLILVRYAQDHDINQEWVYNHADWQHSPVLWARYMNDAWTQRVARAFPDRAIWILDVGTKPTQPPALISNRR